MTSAYRVDANLGLRFQYVFRPPVDGLAATGEVLRTGNRR